MNKINIAFGLFALLFAFTLGVITWEVFSGEYHDPYTGSYPEEALCNEEVKVFF